MRTGPIRDARATFSASVEVAEHGRPTIITRRGRPAAGLVSVEDDRRLHPEVRPSFADLLLSCPGGIDPQRDRTPVRDADL